MNSQSIEYLIDERYLKDQWAGFVSKFTEEFRLAFPDNEIAHNSDFWGHDT